MPAISRIRRPRPAPGAKSARDRKQMLAVFEALTSADPRAGLAYPRSKCLLLCGPCFLRDLASQEARDVIQVWAGQSAQGPSVFVSGAL
jgi:hypothetical protein